MGNTLVIGTRDGLYHHEDGELSRLDDRGGIWSVTRGPEEVYCRHADGVARVAADGSIADIAAVPTSSPTYIRADAAGLVVGSREPLAVCVSPDGADWTRIDLPTLSPAARWIDGERVVVSEAGGRVSDTLRTSAGLVVGVERYGVLVWTGTTWERRTDGLAEDVHDLWHTSPTEWLAATGQGLYETTNAGETWLRVDTGQLFQEYTYFHEFARHDGRLYTSGGKHMPGEWTDHGAEALLFRIGDGRSPLRAADTPTTDEYAWALSGGDQLYVGTATADLDADADGDGVVYRSVRDGWETVCRLPAPVTSVVGFP